MGLTIKDNFANIARLLVSWTRACIPIQHSSYGGDIDLEKKSIEQKCSTPICIDVALGAVTDDIEEQLRMHIESGCGDCARASVIWRQVMTYAHKESLFEPPDCALDFVHGYFALLQAWPEASEVIDVATLAFDSLRDATVASLRGASIIASRQLLYKAGDLCIDIRLESKHGSNQVELTGQLVDAKRIQYATNAIAVYLIGPGKAVSETAANQYGEFNFGFEAAKRLQLFLGIEKRSLIVPLPEPLLEAA
jgi:hypothetical protein